VKVYLGDSVYAAWDGHFLLLTTENGFGPSNAIYLEPRVLEALDLFRKRMKPKPPSPPDTESAAD